MELYNIWRKEVFRHDRKRKIRKTFEGHKPLGKHDILVPLCHSAIQLSVRRYHKKEPARVQGVVDRELQAQDRQSASEGNQLLFGEHWQRELENAVCASAAEGLSGKCHQRG